MKRPRLNLLQSTTLLAWWVAVVIVVIYAVALFPQQKNDLLAALQSKAHGVAVSLRDLGAAAVVTEDYTSVVDHCAGILEGDSGLDYIILTRRDGFSIVNERNRWRVDQLGQKWRPEGREPRSGIEIAPPINRRVFNLSEPFDYSGIEWGWIHVGLSLEAYNASIRRVYVRTSVIGVIAVLAALLASYYYARLLVGPILHLKTVVSRVAAGELTAHAEIRRSDELGELATSVNSMTAAILERDRTLQEANLRLEDRVRERTRELSARITELEQTQRDLAETQRQLVQTSRRAGMAEVATGVLHNVGNVLNSVNISANIVREQFAHDPRIPLLKRTVQLLRDQGDQLPGFLTRDPRGPVALQLIMTIADELVAQRIAAARELTQLSDNIDHIKQIVAVQQNHAKAAGVHQTFDPAELFDDALRIETPSIQRHGIDLQRQYAARRDPLCTDRNLALQILVNLLNNAIQAVKVRPLGERKIVLALTHAHQRVQFTVRDNGVGIAPENRQQLFQHGFSTRKDGHGFGLHSGALAARNLGGSLLVESEGLNRGACFTLDLPLSPPNPSES